MMTTKRPKRVIVPQNGVPYDADLEEDVRHKRPGDAVYVHEDELVRLLAEERPQKEPACKDSIWVFDNTPEHVTDPKRRHGDWAAWPCGKGAMEYVPRGELDAARALLEKMAEALREIVSLAPNRELFSGARAVLAEYDARGEGTP
jgi:hypothetical protein